MLAVLGLQASEIHICLLRVWDLGHQICVRPGLLETGLCAGASGRPGSSTEPLSALGLAAEPACSFVGVGLNSHQPKRLQSKMLQNEVMA